MVEGGCSYGRRLPISTGLGATAITRRGAELVSLGALASSLACSASPAPAPAPAAASTGAPRASVARPSVTPPTLQALEQLAHTACLALTGRDPARVRDCQERLAQALEPFTRGEAPLLTADSVARCMGLSWREALACARVVPGRPAEARCGDDLECASGVCEIEDECGRCRPAAPEGAVCHDGGRSLLAARCAVGLTCRPTTKGERRCSKIVPTHDTPPAPPGAACSPTLPCESGHYCAGPGGLAVNPLTAPSPTQGVCVPLSRVGEPCHSPASCAGLLGCDRASLRCVELSPLGAPCTSSDECAGIALCSHGRCQRPKPPRTDCARPAR